MNVVMRNALFIVASCCSVVCVHAKKNDTSKKKNNVKKVFSRNLDKTCNDIVTSYLRSKGFDFGLLPKHCKKECKQKLDPLLAGFKHDMKINKRDFFPYGNLEHAIAVTLKDFVDYLDTITYRENLEKKVAESMCKKCELEGIKTCGLYEDLAEIFENKKNEICYSLFNVLSKSVDPDSDMRDLSYQIKKDRGRNGEPSKNNELFKRYTNDYFTQEEIDEILEQEMSTFLMFAQNSMVSLWWQELMKHIEEPDPEKAYAMTKIPIAADKRSLLKPPPFVYKKK